MGKSKSKSLVAVYATGIRVHAAERGENKTVCGHDIVSLGAKNGSHVDCRLCQRIIGESKVVLRPRV